MMKYSGDGSVRENQQEGLDIKSRIRIKLYLFCNLEFLYILCP